MISRKKGPGSELLSKGDMNIGFFGEVSGIITRESLIALSGMTAGVVLGTGDITWLKCINNGKILYIAKSPISHSISYDDLNNHELVMGKLLTIGNEFYLLRLLQGNNNELLGVTSLGINNEWENLIRKLHSSGEWGLYTDVDLGINTGNGNAQWVQETGATINSRTYKGHTGVGSFYQTSSNVKSNEFGWRPVLELLSLKTGPKELKYILGSESGYLTVNSSDKLVNVPALTISNINELGTIKLINTPVTDIALTMDKTEISAGKFFHKKKLNLDNIVIQDIKIT